ncbi:hypothetical protein D3C80_1757580 [compost metagenome]
MSLPFGDGSHGKLSMSRLQSVHFDLDMCCETPLYQSVRSRYCWAATRQVKGRRGLIPCVFSMRKTEGGALTCSNMSGTWLSFTRTKAQLAPGYLYCRMIALLFYEGKVGREHYLEAINCGTDWRDWKWKIHFLFNVYI